MPSKKAIQFAMSRRKKNAIVFVFFLLFLPAVIVIDYRAGPPLRQAIERYGLYTEDQQKYHQQTFLVVEVIDGDTLEIDLPDGESSVTRIRMLGIDTPETKHPTIGVMYYGPEAAEYARFLAEGKMVTVLMDTVGDHRDLYGRLLAYIQLEDGRILNEQIIQSGCGYADLRFDHSELQRYERLMDQAIHEKAGLWKEVTRDQLPQWLCRQRPLLLR